MATPLAEARVGFPTRLNINGLATQEGERSGFFQTGFTVDVNRLGLSGLVPSSMNLADVFVGTRQALANSGIRFAQTSSRRDAQYLNRDGIYRFDLLVPTVGLRGLENDTDRMMAVRAHVAEHVIDSMGLGDRLVPVKGWKGRKLFVPDSSVFPPSELGAEFTMDTMPRYSSHIVEKNVLDVATGSGIFAVAAGLLGADQVTATDLNPAALTAAKVSWFVNGLDPDRLHVVESDGFSSLHPSIQYDAILANPPVQPGLGIRGEDDWGRWNETGGDDGRFVLDAILREGPDFLRSPGVILTTTTSRHGYESTNRILYGLHEQGSIDSWEYPTHREIALNNEQYGDYVGYWRARGEETGNPRIFERPDGNLSHYYSVLAISK